MRERLLPYRVPLDDIDLRWGVTREEAEHDATLDVSLHRIDAWPPFFIGILGRRYGFVPERFPESALSKYGWIHFHTGKSIAKLEVLRQQVFPDTLESAGNVTALEGWFA